MSRPPPPPPRALVSSKGAFPNLLRDPASKTVSLVVPAYNESVRMHPMLVPMIAHLEKKAKAEK